MSKIIILAAGKGTRMNSSLPKVLVPVRGKPMIERLLEAIAGSGVDPRPVVIVSPDNKEQIRAALEGFDAEFVVQEQQLGTGHAVACARTALSGSRERIMVFNGDHPFISSETIAQLDKGAKGAITLLTVNLDDFEDWRNNFYHWGRIIREGGKISSIREFKDASEEIKKITEVNPAMYSFDSRWLWENIEKIDTNNNQKEFYLTDLIHLATASGGEKIFSISIEPREAMGINSLEELKIAEQIYG